MPHKGLTWFRFKEHLRKMCGIYFVGIVIMVLLSNLVFTSTRPQIPMEKEVLIYLVDAYADVEGLDAFEAELLAHGQTFDETLETVHFEWLMFNDPNTDTSSVMLLTVRMTLGDGDVFIVTEDALPTILGAENFTPLDEAYANGWLNELEPFYCTTEDGETYMAALKLDPVDGLAQNNIMQNKNAYLIIAANGTNIETSMETAKYVIETLMEGKDVRALGAESAG